MKIHVNRCPYLYAFKNWKETYFVDFKKIAPYLSVKVFSKKVLIGDTIFYVSN